MGSKKTYIVLINKPAMHHCSVYLAQYINVYENHEVDRIPI